MAHSQAAMMENNTAKGKTVEIVEVTTSVAFSYLGKYFIYIYVRLYVTCKTKRNTPLNPDSILSKNIDEQMCVSKGFAKRITSDNPLWFLCLAPSSRSAIRLQSATKKLYDKKLRFRLHQPFFMSAVAAGARRRRPQILCHAIQLQSLCASCASLEFFPKIVLLRRLLMSPSSPHGSSGTSGCWAARDDLHLLPLVSFLPNAQRRVLV